MKTYAVSAIAQQPALMGGGYHTVHEALVQKATNKEAAIVLSVADMKSRYPEGKRWTNYAAKAELVA